MECAGDGTNSMVAELLVVVGGGDGLLVPGALLVRAPMGAVMAAAAAATAEMVAGEVAAAGAGRGFQVVVEITELLAAWCTA